MVFGPLFLVPARTMEAADSCSYVYETRKVTATCSGNTKQYKAYPNYESKEAIKAGRDSGSLSEDEYSYLIAIWEHSGTSADKTLNSKILENYDDDDIFEKEPWFSFKEDGDILEGDFVILHLQPVLPETTNDGYSNLEKIYNTAGSIILTPETFGPTRGGITKDQALLASLNGDDSFEEIILDYANESEEPTSSPRITEGRIAGLLIAGGKWESTFSDIVTKGKVGLYRIEDDGSKSIVDLTGSGSECTGNDNYRTPQDYGGGKYGFSILLKCTEYGNGLLEGKYAVAFAYNENGDAWGDAQPKPWENLFNIDFYGEIQFSITNNPAKAGYGLLTPLGTLDEGEKIATTTEILAADIATKGSIVSVSETSTVENTFADIMNRAINIVLSAVTVVIDWGGKQIHQMLIWGNDIEMDASGATTGKAGIRQVWESTRNMGLSLLTLVLLMVAFANIINVKLDQYGITKIIPKIIIAIVMTYFSFFIAAFLLDLMSALQALLFQEASSGSYFQLSSQINGTIIGQVGQSYNAADLLSKIPELLFLEILCVCVAIVVIWLLLVLIVRNAMIFVLVSIAPIAFLAMILPFTEKYYKQWWASFWKWAFIGPAIAFMLWLTQQFLGGYGASAFGTSGSDTAGAWTFLIAAAVMLWLTATLPLKMGSEVYGQLTKHKDKIPGYKAGKALLDSRKASASQRSAQRAANFRSQLAGVPLLGRSLAGVNSQQAKALKAQTLKSMGENMADDKVALNELIKSSSGLKQEAALLKAASSGVLDSSDPKVIEAVMKYANRKSPSYIPDIEKVIGKENGDFFAAAAMKMGVESDKDHFLTDSAIRGLEKTAVGEYKKDHWDFIGKRSPEKLRQIAGQKSAIDAALKGKPESADEFARQMVSSGAIHSVQDASQQQEILSRAGFNTTPPPTNTQQPTQQGGYQRISPDDDGYED